MLTVLTTHAIRRCAQRNVLHEDIDFIVQHIKPINRAGVAFYQYRRNNMPNFVLPNSRYDQLVGTTVVACRHCKLYILTVYRNPKAFKADDKKQKYDIRNQSLHCPCCRGAIA